MGEKTLDQHPGALGPGGVDGMVDPGYQSSNRRIEIEGRRLAL